jgi:O-antigen/teichoic acid export membrane protein
MFDFIKETINNVNKEKNFQEILHGSALTFGAKIIAVVFGLILNLTITRLYGADSMGVYAIVNSFFAFTLIFCLLGTNTLLLRLIPEYKGNYAFISITNLYFKIIIIVLISSFLLTIFSYYHIDYVAASVFHNIDLRYLLSLATFFIFIEAVSVVNVSVLRALNRVKLFAFFEIIVPLSKLIVLVVLSVFFSSIVNPVYAMLISFLFVMVISFLSVWFCFKSLKKKYSNKAYKNIKSTHYLSILKLSLPMFLTGTIFTVISQIDIIMLSALSNVREVGIYAIAVKLAALTSFVLGAINITVAPKFSELFHKGEIKLLRSVSQKSSKLMFFTTLPIVFVFIVFGKIILSLFGQEFAIAYLSLLVLVLGQFINAAVGSVGYFLNMTGYQITLTIFVAIAGVANVLLNYLLIPIYGMLGSAIGSLISLAIWNVLSALYIKKTFGFYIGYFPAINDK